VVGILRGEQPQAASVEADAIRVPEIGIPSLLPSPGDEVDLPSLFIDVRDPANDPGTVCDLVLHPAAAPVVQVEVTPAAPFRRPDDLSTFAEDLRRKVVCVHVRLGTLVHQDTDRARRRVHLAELDPPVAALDVQVTEPLAVLEPFEPRSPVIEQIEGLGLHRGAGALRHIEDDRLRPGQPQLPRYRVVVGIGDGSQLAFRSTARP
jgi:hypothetical protein